MNDERFKIAAQLYCELFPDTTVTVDGDHPVLEKIGTALDAAVKQATIGYVEVAKRIVEVAKRMRERTETAEASERRLAGMAGEFERRFYSILGPELIARRTEQDVEWGGPSHDDSHSLSDWIRFIRKFTDRASYHGYRDDWESREDKLLDVAALAIAAIQSSRRRRNAGA